MLRTFRKILLPVLAIALLPSLAFARPSAQSNTQVNDTFIYAIEGDPGNDINTVSTGGRYDLTEERLLLFPPSQLLRPR
jgi:hypothetical protein